MNNPRLQDRRSTSKLRACCKVFAVMACRIPGSVFSLAAALALPTAMADEADIPPKLRGASNPPWHGDVQKVDSTDALMCIPSGGICGSSEKAMAATTSCCAGFDCLPPACEHDDWICGTRISGGSCAVIGCGSKSAVGDACQCTEGCADSGTCCGDYSEVCVSNTGTGSPSPETADTASAVRDDSWSIRALGSVVQESAEDSSTAAEGVERVRRPERGWFRLTLVDSWDMCLDVKHHADYSGNTVHISQVVTRDVGQYWTVESQGGQWPDVWQLRWAIHPNMCLSSRGADGIEDMRRLQILECSKSEDEFVLDASMWPTRTSNVPSLFGRLRSKQQPNLCIATEHGRLELGTAVNLVPCRDQDATQFWVVSMFEG
eukprot:TRINITY_DN23643_c0_g1_i1.p1 TRINITY_DN23643_c0_g1~~TRINITY_DN23643_c0_g1_i1.p1  ORF type:complete len:376 (-),score=40.16 TRINITY_DN23643_c0_g1_i1:255-1382(-)